MIKVFMAGPMLNVLNMNAEAFGRWAKELRAAGHDVWNPIEDDWEHGFDPRGYGTEEEVAARMFDFRSAYARNVERLCTWAEALVVLPRWEHSEGASSQVHIAWRLHIPAYPVANFAAWGPEAMQLQRRGHREGSL